MHSGLLFRLELETISLFNYGDALKHLSKLRKLVILDRNNFGSRSDYLSLSHCKELIYLKIVKSRALRILTENYAKETFGDKKMKR